MKVRDCHHTGNPDGSVTVTVISAGTCHPVVIPAEVYEDLIDFDGHLAIKIRRGIPVCYVRVPLLHSAIGAPPLARWIAGAYGNEAIQNRQVHHRYAPLDNRLDSLCPLSVAEHRSLHMKANNPKHRRGTPP